MNVPEKKGGIGPAAVLVWCVGLGVSSPSVATTDDALRAACEAADATPACHFYVAGFLDGALLTDTAIVDSLSGEPASEFLTRAYRTRVGEMRAPPPATALAEFCLPDGVSVDDAATQVVQTLADVGDGADSLQDRVYATVKRLFPCD